MRLELRSAWFWSLALVLCMQTVQVSAAEPQWIWSPEMNPASNPAVTVYFRTAFEVKNPQSAHIEVAADNKYSLFLNGDRIGAGDNWQQLDRYEVTKRLNKGRNVVAIVAENGDPPNPAGLVVRVEVDDEGQKVVASSGTDWKTSTEKQTGWWTSNFNDESWKPAHAFGELGTTGPWGAGAKVVEKPTPVTFEKMERPAGPLQLLDGDRVVFLGDTLIERAQATDYLETRLASRFPQHKIKFRNLGWSADTVFGESRAGFGTIADGFEQLKQRLFEARPTVVILGYGGAASSAGAAGLDEFRLGLDSLLQVVEETKATVVVLSPLKQEDLGKPLPSPEPFNRDRQLYADVLKEVAQSRGYPYVDLFNLMGDGQQSAAGQPFTDNGIHLTPYGYWQLAAVIEEALGWKTPAWNVEIDVVDRGFAANGTKLTDAKVSIQSARFESVDKFLPAPPAPAGSPAAAHVHGSQRVLKVSGLKPGNYVLKIDGEVLTTATADEWGQGRQIPWTAPEFRQAEELRQAILVKNELFFHRWRPQNETYLFGFRKHEQGNNAREIPMFDPLIEKEEDVIGKLRLPVMHKYEVVLEGK